MMNHQPDAEALRRSNTELTKTIADLQASQEALVNRERLRAASEIAEGVAHDFNNALVPILGFCDLMTEQPQLLASPDAARYLNVIRKAAEDGVKVVERLRELHRATMREEPFAAIGVASLVRSAITLAQSKSTNPAQVEIVLDLDETLAVAGEEAALLGALELLISNALEAMPSGGRLTIRAYRQGNHSAIAIQDTGVGMNEDVRTRCITPFFTTKGARGSGLGLSMVQAILQRHIGQLAIESAPGAGSTFTVTLPLHTGSAPREATPAGAARPLRILVVDDEPEVRELLSRRLEIDGHKVEVAAHGGDGLKRFLNGNFDLVLTDKAMPGMSGDQMATAIKQLTPTTPIILLTGFGHMLDKAEFPAIDVLAAKPISMPMLRSAIASALPAA